jgi:hypothetical protein
VCYGAGGLGQADKLSKWYVFYNSKTGLVGRVVAASESSCLRDLPTASF